MVITGGVGLIILLLQEEKGWIYGLVMPCAIKQYGSLNQWKLQTIDDYALISGFESLNRICDDCLTDFFMNKIKVTVRSGDSLGSCFSSGQKAT